MFFVSVLGLGQGQARGAYRAAYWDQNYATHWSDLAITIEIRDFFAAAGYEILDATQLKTWMDARIADGKPSVVIFCPDLVPDTVAETMSATCTIRRYLNAGGKVVFHGDIPFYNQGNRGGGETNWADGGAPAILGFDTAGAPRDSGNTVKITAAGTEWGLTETWVSQRPAATSVITSENLTVLAADNAGNAAAWVKHYVPGDTSAGFVRLFDADDNSSSKPNIEDMLRVAEYGLVDVGIALDPNPDDGATDVSRDVVLSWTPGEFAAAVNGHVVYFSESFGDVNDGVGGVTVSAGSYAPGRLAFDTTYYWRVDEVNAPPDSTVYKGNVWSFTTEPIGYPIDGAKITATASSVGEANLGPENTVNGSGLDNNDLHSTKATDMWLSGMEPAGAWIQYEFDKPYKLHEMWVWNSNQVFESLFGFGLKNVTVEYSTDGATWTALAGVAPFTKASGAAGYAHNTTVGFGGVAAKYVKLSASSNWGGFLPQYSLSEVRFLYVPVNPTTPSPDSGATAVDVVGATLSWRAGREAATHKVSFSADEQAVIGGTAPVASVTTASYSPPALNLSTSYYWKVAEANEAETPSTWESSVWSFTTSDFIAVEDFESYTDFSPNEIYTTWPDGYSDPLNGSQVGNLNPPFAEPTIVHGGKQSMPFIYTNTAGATYSEGKRSFAPARNWTQNGVKALVLWFRGTAGNTGQMYVKINNTKIPYSGAAGNTALPGWQQWTIDLTVPGLNVQSVNSLAIGVDGNAAAGTLYFDDIRLYAVAPAPLVEATIAAEIDDVEERIGPNNGAMDTGSSDLEMPYEDPGKVDPQIIGLRFVGLAIPKGATITNAWVQFSVDELEANQPVNLIIEGELSASPAAFTSTAGNVSSRTKTTAKVQWSVPHWTAVGERGPDQRTPNIASIIQELVNQNGWAGAAMVLMFRDNPANPSTGLRTAGRGSNVVLHIEYQ
jgi:hypothetical protein